MPLILDWLESHAQAGWKRPPALDAGTTTRMREKGVPEPVIALYRAGAHAPGAFPRSSHGDDHLLAPDALQPANEDATRWAITAARGDGAWLVDAEGQVQRARYIVPDYEDEDEDEDGNEREEPGGWEILVDPRPLDEVLAAHLAALTSGGLRWCAELSCFLYPDERPDLDWLDSLQPETRDRLDNWVHDLRGALVRGESVKLGPFGRFSVSTRRAFRGVDGTVIPARHIPVFRQGRALKARLAGTGQQTFDDPVSEALAARLEHGETVGVPGLGSFSVSTRRGFQGAHPQTGAVINVPEARIAIFRSWQRLERAMAAH